MEENRLEFAQRLLRDVGDIVRQGLGIQAGFTVKSPGHIAIPADRAAEERLVAEIRQCFQVDAVFSEEAGFIKTNGEFLWVIDPIDGSNNLRLGLPYASTSIAIQKAGETIASAVYNPFTDEMFVAEKGVGAFLNGERLSVSSQTEPTVGFYAQGYRVPHPVSNEVLRTLALYSHRILNLWAPTLDLCAVARGHAEFFVGYDTEIEDIVQGRLILEEAGGKFTDWFNRPLVCDARSRSRVTVLASNGAVHNQLSAALQRVCLPAVLRGFRSLAEDDALTQVAAKLQQRCPADQADIEHRISKELGLPSAQWRANADLTYIVEKVVCLCTNPLGFVRSIFDGVSPFLSGTAARKTLLATMQRIADEWNPQEHTVEIAAQALEVAASDVRLHDQMARAGCSAVVIENLRRDLKNDSFGVGTRLKRNAFRQIKALAGAGTAELLPEPTTLRLQPSPQTSKIVPTNPPAGLIITGGRGTRLRTSIPKALVPLGGRPLLDYTLDSFQAAGVKDLGVVIGYKAPLHEMTWAKRVVFVQQTEQLGTAHAVKMARSLFAGYAGPLLVAYSDMPFIRADTLRALLEKHEATSAMMTILTTHRHTHPEFGRILRLDGAVCAIGQVRFEAVESNEVDAGFYCFKAPECWEYLDRVDNANNRREFVLTEIVAHLWHDQQKVETYFIDDPVQTTGLNRPDELIATEFEIFKRAYRQMHPDSTTDLLDEGLLKLRFYEAYGGIRIFRMVELLSGNGLQRANAVAESYDRALQQLIGPIFSCSELGGGVPRFGHDHRLGHSNLQERRSCRPE